MTLIDNDDLLESVLTSLLIEIIDEVTIQIMEKLEEFIEDIVYDPYSPKVYPRQAEIGGLLNAWDVTKAVASRNEVVAEIKDDPYSMAHDAGNFIHGSNYWVRKDIRNMLIDIVIKGLSGPIFDSENGDPWWKEPRDFWTPFVKLVESGKINKMIERAFRSRGIKFKKIT